MTVLTGIPGDIRLKRKNWSVSQQIHKETICTIQYSQEPPTFYNIDWIMFSPGAAVVQWLIYCATNR